MNRAFRWRVLVFAASLGIVCGSANRAGAQAGPAPDLASRIDSLEKQLAELKSEMEAQKAAAAAPAPAAAAAVLPTAAPATAPAATGLAGLLGPVTLSGFVDTYYAYNSNQPANRTTALRNFDINSSQFSLNMLELVADKSPDASGSRLGFHIALGYGQAMNLINGSDCPRRMCLERRSSVRPRPSQTSINISRKDTWSISPRSARGCRSTSGSS